LLSQPEEKKTRNCKSFLANKEMAKKLLLSQPEERNHKLQKLPSEENKEALALSTWGGKTTNCKSFLAKKDGKGGLTGALNLRRRTNHILLLLLHSLWRRRTLNQHTIQQMKKFNCKNFTITLKGVQCEVHI
jgi:hypothetical protein